MGRKPSPGLDKFFEWVKQLWAPITGFIGATTLIGKFIELWKGDQTTYTWITAILGFSVLFLALIWVGFSQTDSTKRIILLNENKIFYPRYPSLFKSARFSLILLCILTLVAGYSLYQQFKDLDRKVVVLVTSFDGPDPEKFRVTETIWENLYSALQDYNDVELILLEDISIKSFNEAKIEGNKHNATIVIWGWYATTDEIVRVAAHFDILRQPQMIPESFKSQKTIKNSGITEFQNFLLQDQLSEEMTYLSLTTVGFVRYSLQDWAGAITSFNNALAYTSNEENIQTIQYYIDLSYDIQVTSLPPNEVAILVVSENISQGAVITESVLSILTISREHFISVMFTLDEKTELLKNKVAKYPLDQGVVITESMVLDSTSAIPISGPQWASLIPPGMTAVSIPVCPLSTGTTILNINGTPTVIHCPTPTP